MLNAQWHFTSTPTTPTTNTALTTNHKPQTPAAFAADQFQITTECNTQCTACNNVSMWAYNILGPHQPGERTRPMQLHATLPRSTAGETTRAPIRALPSPTLPLPPPLPPPSPTGSSRQSTYAGSSNSSSNEHGSGNCVQRQQTRQRLSRSSNSNLSSAK